LPNEELIFGVSFEIELDYGVLLRLLWLQRQK